MLVAQGFHCYGQNAFVRRDIVGGEGGGGVLPNKSYIKNIVFIPLQFIRLTWMIDQLRWTVLCAPGEGGGG